MRLYREKSNSDLSRLDLIKNAMFGILLITGLILCPKSDLYSIDIYNIKFYSVGIFLVTMSIMYFLVYLIVNSISKRMVLRILAAVILLTNAVVSIIFISLGGKEVAVGLAIFTGSVVGFMLNHIL